jgi:ribosomal-protein-alanine N-acetyltransferase
MTIKQVTSKEVIPLRHKILRPGRPLESAHFIGDELDTTYHFANLDVTEITAVVTYTKTIEIPKVLQFLNIEAKSFIQLRGMAVDDKLQGKGIGKSLVEATLKVIKKEKEFKVVWCNARTYALPFYSKLGFNVVGEEFEVPSVGPHFIMYKLF